MWSGTLGWPVVWGRVRGRDKGVWMRGLPVHDPSFGWWVSRNLQDAFKFGYALELANDGPTDR